MREFDAIGFLHAIFGVVLGALAVLFNPFFEFHFRRETWRVIDIAAFVCLLLLVLRFYGGFLGDLATLIYRGGEPGIWFFSAGLVGYYVAYGLVDLFGQVVLFSV